MSEDNQANLSITSVVNDKDFDQLTVTARLKSGLSGKDVDSFAVERVVLIWMANHFPEWVKYCTENRMKTL